MTSESVMVIDDDPDFREVIKFVVEGWGFPCLEAADGNSALRLLDERRGLPVRAVLLDYFMPGLPPARCVEELHARLCPATPIVLVSATVDIVARAKELGLEQVLAKPFDLTDLHAILSGEGAVRATRNA